MDTKIFDIEKLNLKEKEKAIYEASQAIKSGELVIFPTETVYGIGADGLNYEAVSNIYKAKGRPSDNPLILHVCDLDMVRDVTDCDLGALEKLAKAFWPGPFTAVLKKSEKVPLITTGGLDTVAVRIPDNDIAVELIRKSGTPIAAPSANISGKPSPTKPEHVIHDMSGKVKIILCGDKCRVGIESTIIDLTNEEPMILRPGIISATQISKVIGRTVAMDAAASIKNRESENDVNPKAPGMKYKHYAPSAQMIILQGKRSDVEREITEIKKQRESQGEKVGVILFEENDFKNAARELFSKLRKMDDDGVDLILAGALDEKDEIGFAVMNRMLKSAGYNVREV